MFLIFMLEGNIWKLHSNPHDENHPCCLLQGNGIFVHVLKVDHYLNNSKMHPVTLKFWKKKTPFPFQGSLNYPFWGDPGFVASFQFGLSEPFEAIFFGGCWSQQGWKLMDLQAGAKNPPGPNSVGWLLQFEFQKMETSRRGLRMLWVRDSWLETKKE